MNAKGKGFSAPSCFDVRACATAGQLARNMPLASTAPQAGTTVVAITRSEGRVTARAAAAKASATSYWSSGPTVGFLSFFLVAQIVTFVPLTPVR